ncbi:MAG: holo-ACP synthase [Elusimicrobiota bacterium]|jgi:holo-[acyl-carrier protein] synthase|nr:holo-ACP synthase [Elusimicrobiota bacterium]
MRIINIGADIEEVARFKRLGKKTLERIFTPAELKYCLSKKNYAECLSARFAAKEAVFKALPFDGIMLKKIEITKDENNKPQISVHDKRAGNISFKISLSHTKNYALAFVIAYMQ